MRDLVVGQDDVRFDRFSQLTQTGAQDQADLRLLGPVTAYGRQRFACRNA